MMRIKLTVAYDGTGYSGWQIQPNSPTVEAALDDAVYRVSGERIHVIGASRTDAGVHGLGNVAVFDTDMNIPAERWAHALNRYLPEDISVISSVQAASDFHPRHCDTVKTYEYRILSSVFPIPQLRNYSWHVKEKLDIPAMQSAAEVLVGEHDFKSFCCVRTQAESTVRTVYSLKVGSVPAPIPGAEFVVIRISGNGFLYNMVRIIAGTLVQAGRGKKSADDVRKMLIAKDRCQAGQTAPPQGLTLVGIEYV